MDHSVSPPPTSDKLAAAHEAVIAELARINVEHPHQPWHEQGAVILTGRFAEEATR